MKIAPVQSRKIKKLLTTIKKEGGKPTPPSDEDPLRILLLGILNNYANEQRAATALNKLISSFVDVNELRVTSIAEIVEAIGKDFPRVRPAAEEISQVLNSIFNRRHDLDLGFLRNQAKKPTEGFLGSLDGLHPHARAFFGQRYLREHVVPLDEHMYFYLQKSGSIPENATLEEAQKMMASQVKDRDGVNFYATFKRYAAAHSPRKLPDKRVTATMPVEDSEKKAKAPKEAAKSPGGSTKASKAPAKSKPPKSAPRKPKTKSK